MYDCTFTDWSRRRRGAPGAEDVVGELALRPTPRRKGWFFGVLPRNRDEHLVVLRWRAMVATKV
jgi:hypothetical protein